MYKQLTMEECEILSQLRSQNCLLAEMARRLGRSRSTITRELARNGGLRGGYSVVAAQRLAEERRRKPRRPCKMNDPRLGKIVRRGLRRYWSPDQIAGRSKLENGPVSSLTVSHQTIDAWINAQQARGRRWDRFLRLRGRPPRRSRKHDPQAPPPSIAGRPAVINHRRRFGDWEGDTIVGAHHRGGILSLVERKSGYTILARVERLQAQQVNEQACRRLRSIPKHLRRSVTFDRGSEFSGYEELSMRLGIEVYFAEPYCAWQRGTNENTNGLVRQFFEKGSDLARMPDAKMSRAENLLNDRPRKRLGYRTPNEVINARCRVALGT
jgi:IS30 family transposase